MFEGHAVCTGGPCRRQGKAISRKIKSRAEQSDTAFTACLRVLLYNILTCYMLVHNASRTCGDIEGRCQILPRRRRGGRRKPRFAGSSRRPSALIHNFCIPSRAAFGVASRDPVPVADRSRRERAAVGVVVDEDRRPVACLQRVSRVDSSPHREDALGEQVRLGAIYRPRDTQADSQTATNVSSLKVWSSVEFGFEEGTPRTGCRWQRSHGQASARRARAAMAWEPAPAYVSRFEPGKRAEARSNAEQEEP